MMKLSKGKFQTILILAIVLAAYLVLAFVIPFAKTAVFWLALVFTLAAFGVQLYVLKLSFTKGKDARSKFYGFPIARIGVVYLIVQIALSFCSWQSQNSAQHGSQALFCTAVGCRCCWRYCCRCNARRGRASGCTAQNRRGRHARAAIPCSCTGFSL